MAVAIVRLGSARADGEGVRIGTVRRPPRGVPKALFAIQDWYDVWFPTLAPSQALMAQGRAATTLVQWRAFARQYRAQMAQPAASQAIALLAVLSQTSDFSVGCYCQDEARCHRSLLRDLLRARGARIVDGDQLGCKVAAPAGMSKRRRSGTGA